MAADVRCELCELPLSQCIHGRPQPAPAPVTRQPPAPRRKPAPRRAAAVPDKPVARRWTPPEAFKPWILAVLSDAGGELEADELFGELEILVDDRLRPGDRETTPEGEPRWQSAARRARVQLIAEGVMAKGRPGVWQLAPRR